MAALAVASVACGLLGAPAAFADGVVNVTLQDATDGGDISGMKMTATARRRQSRADHHPCQQLSRTAWLHEVIVVRPAANGAPLPYDEKSGRVIEKKIADLGEDIGPAGRQVRFADGEPDTRELPADLQSGEPLQGGGCGRSSL